MTPDIEAWDAWHPRVVAERLAGVEFPWCVAAGWAIDLFLGEQTREHGDLEILVPEAHFPALTDRFPECEFWVPGEQKVTPVTPESLATGWQTWAWDTTAWRLDVFRDAGDGSGEWICRRDDRVRLPYERIGVAAEIPYLRPEINLLYKAKWSALEKNKSDFALALPRLSDEAKAWLDGGLALIHPEHEWRRQLS
jgi:hypothetical protein